MKNAIPPENPLIISVCSGKGGTGKSAVSINLAATFSSLGYRTLLIDGARVRGLDLALGASASAIYDYTDLLSGMVSLSEAIIRIPGIPGLNLLTGPSGEEAPPGEPEIRALLEMLKDAYDILLIDTGSGPYDRDPFITASTLLLLVSTPDETSVRALEASEDRFIRQRLRSRMYLLNRVMPELVIRKIEPSIPEIDQRIRCDMAGMVLEDSNIRASMSIGVPVVLKKDSYITENFRKIALRLLHAGGHEPYK